MALLDSTSSKKFYDQKTDQLIVKLRKEGKSVEDISKACGHSEASVQYRIQRVLTKVNDFAEIKYKGAAKPVAKA